MNSQKMLPCLLFTLLLPASFLLGQASNSPSPTPASEGLQSESTTQPASSDPQASDPAPGLAGFETSGSADFGYRFTDIKGAQQGFLQLFDLRRGPRLLDFDFGGTAASGDNPFVDTFSLDASGLGGDPFPSVQLNVSKTNLYDLRANWRQSYFYDDFPLTPSSIAGLSTQAVTDNHDWATVRKIGSLDFNLHASNHLHFLFNYEHTSDSGQTFTTRALDFVGSPDVWGAFARANPYVLGAPVNDVADRFTGGLSYALRNWSFQYQIGYQTYNDTLALNNVTSPQRSVNVNDPTTASELLTSLSWSQARRLTTPISEFSYTEKPLQDLEMEGEYIYYRYQGPLSLDATFNGSARTNTGGTTDSPYDVSISARGNVSEPNNIIRQSFVYTPADWWQFDVTYGYSRFTTNTTGNFSSLSALYPFAPGGPTTNTGSEVDHINWIDGVSTLDIDMMFTPGHSLVIRPGVEFVKADIESLEDGVADPARTARIKTAWPELSIFYQPSKKFSVRGTYRGIYNNAGYTNMSPLQTNGTTEVVRFQPTEKWAVEDALDISNSRLLSEGFLSRTRSNAATLSYTLNERLSLFAGFTYQTLLGLGQVTFLRGTPPITDVPMRDQELDRIWQAGFTSKPRHNIGVEFSGNFMRTTGLDTIYGEPPLYGPVTWPYATGTVYYEFPKAGRLSIDLQRTYYLQQILNLNNFSANMLTIRWTKHF